MSPTALRLPPCLPALSANVSPNVSHFLVHLVPISRSRGRYFDFPLPFPIHGAGFCGTLQPRLPVVSQMSSLVVQMMWFARCFLPPNCLLVVFNLSPTTPICLPHVVSRLSPSCLPDVFQLCSNCHPVVSRVVSQLSPRCHPGAASQMMSASCVQGFSACCLVVVIFPFSLR